MYFHGRASVWWKQSLFSDKTFNLKKIIIKSTSFLIFPTAFFLSAGGIQVHCAFNVQYMMWLNARLIVYDVVSIICCSVYLILWMLVVQMTVVRCKGRSVQIHLSVNCKLVGAHSFALYWLRWHIKFTLTNFPS